MENSSATARVTWRVHAEALPRVGRRCPRCDRKTEFVCAERFRVNSNGKRLDAWLIYRCERCGARYNREVFARQPVVALPPGLLERLMADEPSLVRRYAFEGGLVGEPVVDVVGDEASEAPLEITIALVDPCEIRLDRLLARQLGLSRAAVARLEREGRLRVTPGRRSALRRPARSGQRISLASRRGSGSRRRVR